MFYKLATPQYIPRPAYLERIRPFIGTPLINKELHEFREIRDGDELYRSGSERLKGDAPNSSTKSRRSRASNMSFAVS
jgi:hypothetical protein